MQPLLAIAHVAVYEHTLAGHIKPGQIDALAGELKSVHIALRSADTTALRTYGCEGGERDVEGLSDAHDAVRAHYFLTESIECFFAYIVRRRQLMARSVDTADGGAVSSRGLTVDIGRQPGESTSSAGALRDIEQALGVCFDLGSAVGVRNLERVYGPFTRYMTTDYVHAAFRSGDLETVQLAMAGMESSPVLADGTVPYLWGEIYGRARRVAHTHLSCVAYDSAYVEIAKWVIETYGLPRMMRPGEGRFSEGLLWYLFEVHLPTQIDWVRTHMYAIHASLNGFVDDEKWAKVWKWLLTVHSAYPTVMVDHFGGSTYGRPVLHKRQLPIWTWNLFRRLCDDARCGETIGHIGLPPHHLKCRAVCRTLDMMIRCTREFCERHPREASVKDEHRIDLPINYILGHVTGVLSDSNSDGHVRWSGRKNPNPTIRELAALTETSTVVCVHLLEVLYSHRRRLSPAVISTFALHRPQDIPRMIELGMMPAPSNVVDHILSMRCDHRNADTVATLTALKRQGHAPSEEFIRKVNDAPTSQLTLTKGKSTVSPQGRTTSYTEARYADSRKRLLQIFLTEV